MALNNYIRFTGVKNEQDLAQSLIDEHIKIHGVEITSIKSPGNPGDIISFDRSGLTIKTIDYDIVITHLQFPNKNIITAKDAYNSYRQFFV